MNELSVVCGLGRQQVFQTRRFWNEFKRGGGPTIHVSTAVGRPPPVMVQLGGRSFRARPAKWSRAQFKIAPRARRRQSLARKRFLQRPRPSTVATGTLLPAVWMRMVPLQPRLMSATASFASKRTTMAAPAAANIRTIKTSLAARRSLSPLASLGPCGNGRRRALGGASSDASSVTLRQAIRGRFAQNGRWFPCKAIQSRDRPCADDRLNR